MNDHVTNYKVPARTLQRHVVDETQRTPVYWLNLGRARKCARAFAKTGSLLDTAINCGFTDQSHMNREFQRWFRTTPKAFQRNRMLMEQINMPGYGDV